MKILVIAPSWIGDSIIAQPLFTRLHERHPGLILDVFAPPWVAPALAHMAEVRRIIVNPYTHGQLRLAGRWRLGRQLAREGYDATIVLPNSWKSALLPLFAGIRSRIGFLGEARYGLINRIVPLNKQAVPLLVDRYALLAGGDNNPSTPLPEATLIVDPREMRATLASLGLSDDPAPVVFCPGAEYGPAKRWPAEHFAALARELHADGHPVWLVGSAKDATIGNEIAAQAPGACANLCGKTTLAQAIALIAAARLVVSNDSGLMHVAAALKRPLVALFGSSSPRYTPPLSKQAQVIWLELACSPCFERICPLGHFRCMQDITPARVLQLARQSL